MSGVNIILQRQRQQRLILRALSLCRPNESLPRQLEGNQQRRWTAVKHLSTTSTSPTLSGKSILQGECLPGNCVNQLRLLSTLSKKGRIAIPRKAPIKFTSKARKFFKSLLEHKIKSNGSDDAIVGIMLKYKQSQTGEPRMVYTFDFVKQNQITKRDEPVSLEVVKSSEDEDGSGGQHEEIPKSPEDSIDDGLPKLYIHQHAFLKVLGCTIDIDEVNLTPILFDREGNVLDPNA